MNSTEKERKSCQERKRDKERKKERKKGRERKKERKRGKERKNETEKGTDRDRLFDRITFFRNSSVVLSKFVSKEKIPSFEYSSRLNVLSNDVLSKFERTKFERKKRTFSHQSHQSSLW
jgi:hypothetical protein